MASQWYQATADAAAIPPDVAERALEWLLELQGLQGSRGSQGGGAAPEVVDAWRRWRAEHPDHERAWQRIESVRGRLQPLASPLTSEIARAALAPPRSPKRRRAIKVLAVSLFAGGLAWTARDHSPWRQWAADYRTAVGERRSLVLADGTQLWLNTASAVDIDFGPTERRVKLLAGEILIATAKDDAPTPRPFLVETAQGTAQALGTRYVVRQRGDDTDVSVLEGKVEIRPNGNAGRSIVLPAGYRASYTAHSITAPAPAGTAGAAWAEGFIVARSMRLDDFIAELGRYSQDSLSCDPALGGVRVSGSFPLDDIGKVLSALSTTLDVRTDVVTRLWGRREIRITRDPPQS
ncbi:FecR family protein [Cupriavidus gilardii]|uniref:FecR family protein n=1 Tax=Cupriavidus gilardii TaxID=82541 RepID=UPI001EE58549|nr:FecR family protein [Cupriavidus gilardii]MCG5260416.1 FecR family protein [Cupriavidus gilardii]